MTYTIPKGWHYCLPPHWGHYSDVSCVSLKVMFDESAFYDIGQDETDINKLWGFRDSLLSNHKNSARFGWRPDLEKNKVELLGYCYDKGVRLNSSGNEKSAAFIDIKKEYNTIIYTTTNMYRFEVWNSYVMLGFSEQSKTATFTSAWKSSPYFGGNIKSPHKIKLKLY